MADPSLAENAAAHAKIVVAFDPDVVAAVAAPALNALKSEEPILGGTTAPIRIRA